MFTSKKIVHFTYKFKSLFVVALFICTQLSGLAHALENRVKDSPSPYLAAHGSDPVEWQEWNPATLELARKENKLLFVSIGYFSCHWCHVMQAESYRNPEIAALINKNFIPVKVDREIDVALDAEMIAYAQTTLGRAGWPLNVFITPEGYPLYSILYEPPERFKLMLNSLGTEWLKDSAGLKAIAQNSVKKVQTAVKVKPTVALTSKYQKQLISEALEQADLLSGGLNVPRKFPLSPQLTALLEIEAHEHDAKLAEWLRLTLDKMAEGGLRDHLSGGFFRYTVDPGWQKPHFEKMLYDNAQLAIIYLRAAAILKKPAYRDIAIDTLDFMLRDMRVDSGFITSISAVDEQGKEGGSYLWTEVQLKAVLDAEEYQLVYKVWGMSAASEFEDGYLPQYRMVPSADELKRLQGINLKLLQQLNTRVVPKDTKLLAGLNGMMLETLSEVAVLSPRYRQAADELVAFMLKQLWQNEVLYKGISKQQLLGQGDLEAYAYTSSGLMRYAQLSGKKADRNIALQMQKLAWQKFHTPNGFLLEQGSELARPYYQVAVEDGPLPSSSAVLIKSSLQSGDKALRQNAIDALAYGDAVLQSGVFWFSTQVMALNRLFQTHAKH